MRLQDLCPKGSLQGQQRAVVMHLQLRLAAVTLHTTNQLKPLETMLWHISTHIECGSEVEIFSGKIPFNGLGLPLPR